MARFDVKEEEVELVVSRWRARIARILPIMVRAGLLNVLDHRLACLMIVTEIVVVVRRWQERRLGSWRS